MVFGSVAGRLRDVDEVCGGVGFWEAKGVRALLSG